MLKWTRPSWGTGCRRSPKSLSSAKQRLFAVPALSSKVLAGLAFCKMLSQDPVCFSWGCPAGSGGGGQQQFATQTLCVHLLGLDCLSPEMLRFSCERPHSPRKLQWATGRSESRFPESSSKVGQEYEKHACTIQKRPLVRNSVCSQLRTDFREGDDEDSIFSVFRVRRFTASLGPLH